MVGDGENSQILSKSKGKKDKLEMTRQVLPSHSTHSLCFHLTLAAWPTPSTVSSRPRPSKPVFLGTPYLLLQQCFVPADPSTGKGLLRPGPPPPQLANPHLSLRPYLRPGILQAALSVSLLRRRSCSEPTHCCHPSASVCKAALRSYRSQPAA